MSFVLGILAGMLILAFVKSKRVKVAFGLMQPYALPSVVVSLGVYLIVVNWEEFVRPKRVVSWKGLERTLLTNPANETVILLAIFVGFIGILSYILRLPLSNWQQIKLFGLFEATRLKEEAKDQFGAFRKLEWDRMTSLGAMASELGLMAIEERMDGLDLDASSVLDTFCEAIVSCYNGSDLNAPMTAGHFAEADPAGELSPLVREAVRFANPVAIPGDWASAMAVRLRFGSATYVTWFHAINYTFTETDAAYVDAMASIVESNFERALVMAHLDEVGISDEP